MGKQMISKNGYKEAERRSQESLSMIGIYTFRYFPKEKRIIVSDLLCERYSVNKETDNIYDNDLLIHVNEEDKDRFIALFEQIDGGEERVSARFNSTDGKRLFEIILVVMDRDEAGEPESVIGFVENLEESKKQYEMIHALADNFDSVFYVNFDNDEVLTIRVNDNVRKLLGDQLDGGCSYEQLMFEYIEQGIFEADKERMRQEMAVENLRKQLAKKNAYHYDFRIARDGGKNYYRVKCVNVSGKGELHRMVVGFADVSSEKGKELERLAYYDAVTGGENYIYFKKELQENGRKGYLIAMDIRAFKIVNTICGIAKGDETLRSIWRVIKDNLYEDELAGHVNADKFVLYMKEKTQKMVLARLNKIKEDLEHLSYELHIPVMEPYFGVTEWKNDKSVEEGYSEANFAKKQIKERREKTCQFYSKADTKKMLEEKQMEDSFLDDLNAGRFEVWYQPKFDPQTEELIGAEGLVRWRKEDGSLISPGLFIPLFERDGLIKILDEYVFMSVCQQQMQWKKEGKKIVPVSINLSRASLYYETVVADYHNIADEIGIDTSYVPIEITESAAVDNNNIIQLSEKFHERGFALQVDDFGAGYSSLATLNMKCFDVLKIDKSLIDYIGDYSGECLLEHTVALAKQLGLYVTAEGVEREEQVAFLKKIHCDSIQGYYYAKPMPANEYASCI